MYSYQEIRPRLFTDEGQRMFLRILDRARTLVREAGAVRCDKLLAAAGSGDSWEMLACVDRLVELGELRELSIGSVVGQHRVFVSGRTE